MRDTARIQAVLEELSQAAEKYNSAKDTFDGAQVRFESALQRFTSMRQFAMQTLDGMTWFNWHVQHPQVRYVGMPIGEAITQVLSSHAYASAENHGKPHGRGIALYNPYMELQPITEALEDGGYEFRSTAPLREVNAALVNLKGIVKLERKDGKAYRVESSDEILQVIKDIDARGEEEAEA